MIFEYEFFRFTFVVSTSQLNPGQPKVIRHPLDVMSGTGSELKQDKKHFLHVRVKNVMLCQSFYPLRPIQLWGKDSSDTWWILTVEG